MIHRRTFLRGLFAMPAIVTAANLMPIRGERLLWGGLDGAGLRQLELVIIDPDQDYTIVFHHDPPIVCAGIEFGRWHTDT